MINLAQFFEQVRETTDQGTQDQAKKAAALAALDLVKPGMTLGLGTGSTVDFFLVGLAERLSEGLEIRGGIPTSAQTERRASELGIPLLGSPGFTTMDTNLCVDGADRVDLQGNLLKGGGGALLREKLVAYHSQRVCILVDPSKICDQFDHSFAVPVECLEFGIDSTIRELEKLGCRASLRVLATQQPFRTDNGHRIVDCALDLIPEPAETLGSMMAIPGVIDVGIFEGLVSDLIVGFKNGTTLRWSRED